MKQTATKIRALARGLDLLELVAARGGDRALTEISREAGLHRSTAHHLLKTLVLLGYVVQDKSSRTYRVGPKVQCLASSAWSGKQLARVALPYLLELVRATGERVNLAVRRENELLLLEAVDGEGKLKAVDREAATRPLYACAAGKALLAFAPPEEREAIVSALRFERWTPRTIVDHDELRRELRRVRQKGRALNDEEMILGVRFIAAPVFALPGHAVAAIAVARPAAGETRSARAKLEKPLAAAVRRLSARLSRGAHLAA